MIPLLNCDLNKVLARVPQDVRELMQKEGLILAGGFIRGIIAGEDVADIDLFGDSYGHLKTVAAQLAEARKIRVHVTDHAFTLLGVGHTPVQFITRWTYQKAEDVIQSFDFTVCQAAIWWRKCEVCSDALIVERWVGECSERFYPDLAARRLYYTNPTREEEAGGSLLRVRKYLKRVYNIQIESLGNVIGRIVDKVDMKKTEGSKLTTGEIVQGLLREVDPRIKIDGTVEEE